MADISWNYATRSRSHVRDTIEELATDVELLRTYRPDHIEDLSDAVVL